MKSRKLSPTRRMIMAAGVEQLLALPLLIATHPMELATLKTLRSSTGDFFFLLLLLYSIPAGKDTKTTDNNKLKLLIRTGGRCMIWTIALFGAESLKKAKNIENMFQFIVNRS